MRLPRDNLKTGSSANIAVQYLIHLCDLGCWHIHAINGMITFLADKLSYWNADI